MESVWVSHRVFQQRGGGACGLDRVVVYSRGQFETVARCVLGNTADVGLRPAGEIPGDVVNFVFGRMPVGDAEQVAGERRLGGMDPVQGELHAVHDWPPAIRVSRTAAA